MELFQSDAMAPPTASSKNMQAWSKKIKHGRWTRIPNGITALADKIGVESDADVTIAGFSLEDVDLDAVVDSICGFGNDDNALLV